ncbi:hypothetical protein JB92DRAFT_145983 [Gautieria morchelliformis]|nr:hypothetical protein JB92DRAFT_145983 [Gautieria morchelliformis]
MLRLSRMLVAVTQAVIRGVARHSDVKLPGVEAHVFELNKDVTSAPWLALDPTVWPFQHTDEKPVISRAPGSLALISKSLDFLSCSSSPITSATPSMSSEDNSSTVRMLTMPASCIPNIVVQSEHLHTGVIPPSQIMMLRKLVTCFLRKQQRCVSLLDQMLTRWFGRIPRRWDFWHPRALPLF